MTWGGTQGGGSTGAADRAAEVAEANAEMAERAAVLRQCPECESVHYKQVRRIGKSFGPVAPSVATSRTRRSAP